MSAVKSIIVTDLMSEPLLKRNTAGNQETALSVKRHRYIISIRVCVRIRHSIQSALPKGVGVSIWFKQYRSVPLSLPVSREH